MSSSVSPIRESIRELIREFIREPSVIKPLTGITVLVTRPAHQAGGLADMICAAGGTPILFPVFEILDVADPCSLLELIRRLDEFDLAIFISPNAVNKAMNLIDRCSLTPRLRFAAVGQGTVKTLEKFGIDAVIAPTTRFDSEALLDMVELKQVEGKHVVIFGRRRTRATG